MRRDLAAARARLAARPGRVTLIAAGVVAAAAMAATAASVSYGLHSGFDRAASRADLADVRAHFEPLPLSQVDRRASALPNLAARSYRLEIDGVSLSTGAHATGKGALELLEGRRRGYTVVAGRDVFDRTGEVLVERGLADSWGLAVGDRLRVGRLGWQRVVGVVVEPGNVAFPLASVAHVYASGPALRRHLRFGGPVVNTLELWAQDQAQLPALLTQARLSSFGLARLELATRRGVRVLVAQAAGIVIALLVAFAIVTLGCAGLVLATSSHAEVQRQLPTVGVQRALGFGRGRVAGAFALDALLVALPAAGLGTVAGGLVAAAPTASLLHALNQLPPGLALIPVLVTVWLCTVVLVAAAAAWPAWRASSRPPATLLRRGDLAGRQNGRSLGQGFLALGVRVAASRPLRTGASALVIGAAASVILLMLALASLLSALETNPATVGKRYQLSASLPAQDASAVERVPGVAAAAPRYEVDAATSFALDQPLRLIAYPGDHTRFEDPPLATGRRVRDAGEAEVGSGLVDAVGLAPGALLPVQLASGKEVRFRVVGVVRTLANQGRVAYVRSRRVVAADPAATATIAVRLEPGASAAAVTRRLTRLGAAPQATGAATSRSAGFIGIVVALVRIIAGVVGLSCLYALAQSLALTAGERRQTVAVLRAIGAGPRAVASMFAGAGLAVAVPAAILAVALERLALAPLVGALAASYAPLDLRAGPSLAAAVLLGLGALAVLAAAWTARRTARAPVVAGLRR